MESMRLSICSDETVALTSSIMDLSIFLNWSRWRNPDLLASYMSNISFSLSSGEPLEKMTDMSRNSRNEIKPFPSLSISWNICSTKRESSFRLIASANSLRVSSHSRTSGRISPAVLLKPSVPAWLKTDLKKFSTSLWRSFMVNTFAIMSFFLGSSMERLIPHSLRKAFNLSTIAMRSMGVLVLTMMSYSLGILMTR